MEKIEQLELKISILSLMLHMHYNIYSRKIENGVYKVIINDKKYEPLSVLSMVGDCVGKDLDFYDKELISMADYMISQTTNKDYIKTYWKIRNMTYMYHAWKSSLNEFTIQKLFTDKIQAVSNNQYKIIQHHNLQKHQPDAWVKDQEINQELPVEVKLHDFNNKALEQLQRYIKVYNSSGGIAVGESLTCTLPENIVFYSIEDLKK